MVPRIGRDMGLVDDGEGRGSWASIWAEAYFRPWKTEVRLVESMRWYSVRGLDQIGWGLETPVFFAG
jgi:hypothetical protein